MSDKKTTLSIPAELGMRLRMFVARKSIKENRKVLLSEVVTEALEKMLKEEKL
jgi:hypothetical protein